MKNFLLGVMTTALCLVAMGANYQAAGPKKYEYKFVHHNSTNMGPDGGINKILNKDAADGWKLTTVNSAPNGGNYYFFFEREKR
jgi:hypothetical protein